jgi:hypothetical protein
MEKKSQLHKIISVFMIFIILIQLVSCYTIKKISTSEIPISGNGNYKLGKGNYIFHSKKSNYNLKLDTVIMNENFIGKVDFTNSKLRGKKIYIYISSDSLIKFNDSNIMLSDTSIKPNDCIISFPSQEFSLGKTKYDYVVHSEKAKFLLEKSTISNGMLSGKIIAYNNHFNTINLYISSDSAMIIDKEGILSVPLDNIEILKMKKFNVPLTVLCGALAISVVAGFIGFLNNGIGQIDLGPLK